MGSADEEDVVSDPNLYALRGAPVDKQLPPTVRFLENWGQPSSSNQATISLTGMRILKSRVGMQLLGALLIALLPLAPLAFYQPPGPCALTSAECDERARWVSLATIAVMILFLVPGILVLRRAALLPEAPALPAPLVPVGGSRPSPGRVLVHLGIMIIISAILLPVFRTLPDGPLCIDQSEACRKMREENDRRATAGPLAVAALGFAIAGTGIVIAIRKRIRPSWLEREEPDCERTSPPGNRAGRPHRRDARGRWSRGPPSRSPGRRGRCR